MSAERVAVRAMFSWFAVGMVITLLGHTTESSSPGIALAFFIMASPLVLIAIGVWLKVRTHPAKEADSGTRESARAVGRTMFFLGFMFAAGFVVLGSGISTSVIVICLFILGLVSAALILGAIFGPSLPRTVIGLRSMFGSRRELHRGVGLYLDGRVQEALDAFRRSQLQFPNDPDALFWQSAVFIARNELDTALELADEGISVERTASGLVQRAGLLLAIGCDELALVDAEEAFRLSPNGWTVAYVRGAALISLRRLDAAIAVLRADPHAKRSVWSRYALGDAHRLRSEPEAANVAYEQACRLAPFYIRYDPRRSEGRWACALAQLGRWDDAERHISATLERNPADALALYARALCEKELGWYDALAETFKALLPVDFGGHVVGALTDPQFTPLLAEKRFRELLAWALGAQRQARERVLAQRRLANQGESRQEP